VGGIAIEIVTTIEIVITGLAPVIHLSSKATRYEDGWMPGSSPGMTDAFCGAR
jgi:hypothetical protein